MTQSHGRAIVKFIRLNKSRLPLLLTYLSAACEYAKIFVVIFKRGAEGDDDCVQFNLRTKQAVEFSMSMALVKSKIRKF